MRSVILIVSGFFVLSYVLFSGQIIAVYLFGILSQVNNSNYLYLWFYDQHDFHVVFKLNFFRKQFIAQLYDFEALSLTCAYKWYISTEKYCRGEDFQFLSNMYVSRRRYINVMLGNAVFSRSRIFKGTQTIPKSNIKCLCSLNNTKNAQQGNAIYTFHIFNKTLRRGFTNINCL